MRFENRSGKGIVGGGYGDLVLVEVATTMAIWAKNSLIRR